MFLDGQLDLAEVAPQAGSLEAEPPLVYPRLQLITVVEELKPSQLDLQLLPPAETPGKSYAHLEATCIQSRALQLGVRVL